MAQEYCDFGDCTELSARDGKCWTHYRWAREGKNSGEKNLRKNGMDPLERLTEAAIAYVDCDVADDGAFRRAIDNLRKSAERYVVKLWRERSREGQRLAKRRGKHIGRPKKTVELSRWTKWRRSRFQEAIAGAAKR